jgi:aarF domain-containing kinase
MLCDAYCAVVVLCAFLRRDYTEIGQDFRNLDFIPEGVDTAPIIPALSRVFDAALVGASQ